MSTYKELVYMCIDEIGISSDDSNFTQDHIVFLLSKYRTLLLLQKYSDLKNVMSESNYQTICLDLEVSPESSDYCSQDSYLKSIQQIPNILKIGNPRVYPLDYYQGEITYVTRDRMRYVGYNKYLQNIIYCSISPDNHLQFKSSNPQFLHLEKVKFTAIFEDAVKASELECGTEEVCDILDKEFPIEESLVQQLIGLVVKELKSAEYSPEDSENNAMDDLSNLINFIRRNAKSNLQKQIEE